MEKVIELAARSENRGIVHTGIEELRTWAKRLPAIERRGFEAALEYIKDIERDEEKEVAVMALQRVILARIRNMRIQQNDVRSRTLIGTRVKRDFACMCRDAARASGRSLNQWVYAALWNTILHQSRFVEHEVPENDSNNIWYGWH